MGVRRLIWMRASPAFRWIGIPVLSMASPGDGWAN
jgi:hypothetical protein